LIITDTLDDLCLCKKREREREQLTDLKNSFSFSHFNLIKLQVKQYILSFTIHSHSLAINNLFNEFLTLGSNFLEKFLEKF